MTEQDAIDEGQWFGEARAALQAPPSRGQWMRLVEFVQRAHNEPWFVERALPYLKQSLRRWPRGQRPMPASWVGELVEQLRSARTLGEEERIPWTQIFRGRWDHFQLVDDVRLHPDQWEDPLELMEVVRRCAHAKRFECFAYMRHTHYRQRDSAQLEAREVRALKFMSELESLELADVAWRIDDLGGSGSLRAIWPNLSSLGYFPRRGDSPKALDRICETIEEAPLERLTLAQLDNASLRKVFSVLMAHPPDELRTQRLQAYNLPEMDDTLRLRAFSAHKSSPHRHTFLESCMIGPTLEYLSMRRSHEYIDSTSPEYTAIADTPARDSLRVLDLFASRDVSPAQEGLKRCPNLVAMDLGFSDTFNAGSPTGADELLRREMLGEVEELLHASEEGQWRGLGLRSRLVISEDAEFERLRAALQRGAWEVLDLGRCFAEEGAFAQLFGGAEGIPTHSLRALTWRQNTMNDDDIDALCEVCAAGVLERLDLSRCDLTDEQVERLLGAAPAQMHTLQLGYNHALTARGYAAMLHYAARAQVQALGIGVAEGAWGSVRMEYIKAWRQIREMPSLRALEIGSEHQMFIDAMVRKIGFLQGLETLYARRLEPRDDNTWIWTARRKGRWIRRQLGEMEPAPLRALLRE